MPEQLIKALLAKNWHITTAESCTGGMVAAAITEIAGASDVFERGFVTYANSAKTELLGVSADRLATHGAVSPDVANAMATGALAAAKADIAIAITGIAGPGGGSADKPVGLVYIAIATKTGTKTHKHIFSGTRQDIRTQSRDHALQYALETIQ